MSTKRIITICCYVVSALALIGLSAWFLFSDAVGLNITGINFGGGSYSYAGSVSVSADGIDSLEIDWTSGAVYVFVHDGNDIRVSEFSRRNLRDGDNMHVRTVGNTLSIDFVEGRRVMRNMPSKRLEVMIPRAISADFQNVDVSTVSGRVIISDLSADRFNASTVSGRIELVNINSPVINANTTSGRVEAIRVNAQSATLRTISGRVEVRGNSTIYNLSANTTSGRIDLNGAFDIVNTRTASGRIEIVSTVLPGDLSAQTASGRISVTVPGDGPPIAVQHSIGSGRFSSDIPILTGGGVDAQFRLSTGSGRIEILALR